MNFKFFLSLFLFNSKFVFETKINCEEFEYGFRQFLKSSKNFEGKINNFHLDANYMSNFLNRYPAPLPLVGVNFLLKQEMNKNTISGKFTLNIIPIAIFSFGCIVIIVAYLTNWDGSLPNFQTFQLIP